MLEILIDIIIAINVI